MLKNYLISSLRSLIGDRLYASINTIGLAIGLATGFLIFSWVKQELKYDRQYEGHERVYRVVTGWDESPDEGIASTYPMMKEKVLARFQEVEACARLFNPGFLGDRTRVTIGDKIFTDTKVFYGDTSFFRLFPFRLIKGSQLHLFDLPNAVVLSERAANIYFGNEDPQGKTIWIDNAKELVVTGVMENIPTTTHFTFDMLVSMESHSWIKNAEERLWSGIVFYTYIKLKPGSDPQQLTAKINDYLDHFPDDPKGQGKELTVTLQPVTDIHLNSHLKWELQPGGNITYIYLFIAIAILAIVVACINYINLATARYTQRVKEVGIRKVMGALRKQLIFQFMAESLILALVALMFSAILVELGRPWLEQITGQTLPVAEFYSWQAGLLFLGTALLVGLVSGFFPALVLSSYKPIQLFKPGLDSPGGTSIRKGLVVFQFVVSIILTVCTVVIYRQLAFVHRANLGYDKEQVLVLPIHHDEVLPRYKEFKASLLVNSNILRVSATSQLPSNITEGENIDISPSESRGVYCVSVDEDFFETLNISIKEGKERMNEIQPIKDINQFVLNESALAEIGWTKQDALGKMISIRHGNMQPGQVVGVISDYHFQSLHEPIGPLVIEFDPTQYEYLLVKIKPGKATESLAFISSQWKSFAGKVPFDYSFLDQRYDQLYQGEKRIGSLFLVLASIASFIALLGLFGLGSFAVEKRTKEIGIRKVLGAGLYNIIGLLMKEFSWLLLIALAIAIPVSYYYTSQWLQTFAYRSTLTLSVFGISGMINVGFAAILMLYHAVRASSNNPVESLRKE